MNQSVKKHHHFLVIFMFLFAAYTVLAMSGIDGRPLEFMIGFTLCGTLTELVNGPNAIIE